MNKRDIKNKVKEHYGKIANQNQCCCSSSCCGDIPQINPLVEYGNLGEEVKEANLGLGCGIPTEFAKIKQGDIVVDLGSGAGIDVFIASKIVGLTGRVIGIDMTKEMIEKARENALKGGFTNVEFRLGDLEALPLDDSTIDVVISNCVINLVPDKLEAFREIYRVLKNGGHFTISDIVTFGNVPKEIRDNIELWAGCIAGALDQQEYLKIIDEIGFKDIKVLDYKKYPQMSNNNYGIMSMTIEGFK